MGRPRVHTSAAERQRSYRLRLANKAGTETRPSPQVGRKKSLSRPARVTAITEEVERLHGEYEKWLDALPESQQDGDQAEKLRETIEQLQDILDILSDLDPPRGFGRD